MDRDERDVSVTVDTSSLEVAPDLAGGSARRVTIIVTNISTGGQVISLAKNKAAQANKGAVLYPGGSWSQSRSDDFQPTQTQINAISSAAGGIVAVSESIERSY